MIMINRFIHQLRHFTSLNCHEKNYYWQGKNHHGKNISGNITAQSIHLAMADLQKKGIQTFSIKRKRRPLFKNTVSQFDIILFFRQLSTLISAGISISQAIHINGQQSEQSELLKITQSIDKDITAGNGLAYAMRKFPLFFDEMICNLILTGEKSGTLDTMLKRIAEHKERSYQLKSKIRQALFYPMMILIVAILITIIMLLFVVPRFTELFQNMHATLPGFTLSVIYFANFLKNNWLIIIFIFIISTSWFYYAKRFPRIRFIMHTFQLKIPVIGLSLQKYILASFARSLTTLLVAGIPITEALKMLAHSMHNLVYRNDLHELYLHISAGKQLHFAMQYSTLFPSMMVHMIQTGEESGTLETMLAKIADFYESDLDQMVGYLGRLLEPLIMVILGVVIGSLVIAMYLPIFKLGDVI